MYNIAIRADGGAAVGMGHIMRCLAIAGELRNQGCKVYFIGKYTQGINKAKEMDFGAFEITLPSRESQCNTDTITSVDTYNHANTGFNYGSKDDLEDDIFATRGIIEQQGCDLLIVDKYNLSSDYFIKLKDFVKKIAFIDDLNLFDCVADIIINGNINAKILGYNQKFSEQSLLLGTNYTPLRTEFISIPKKEVRVLLKWQSILKSTNFSQKTIKERKDYNLINSSQVGENNECVLKNDIPEIMITTGGSDPYNCTGQLLTILLGCKKTANIRYNVIIGSGFVYIDDIRQIAEKHSNVFLYINYKYLSEIMLRSDLAISSGGSTLYELCCCGTPTLAFILADNQKGIVDMLSNQEYIQSLGWYTDLDKANIAQRVYDLILNFDMRRNYADKMQELIDGKGANRIASEIIRIIADISIYE